MASRLRLMVAQCGLRRSATNSVIRILLDPKGNPRVAQHSPLCVYRNAGSSNVDTHAMDENGFIYVGIMMGGRAVILDQRRYSRSEHPGSQASRRGSCATRQILSLKQDACEGYLLASDDERAVVLRFETLGARTKVVCDSNRRTQLRCRQPRKQKDVALG